MPHFLKLNTARHLLPSLEDEETHSVRAKSDSQPGDYSGDIKFETLLGLYRWAQKAHRHARPGSDREYDEIRCAIALAGEHPVRFSAQADHGSGTCWPTPSHIK